MNPDDNALAIDQIEVAYSTLLNRPIASQEDAVSATRNLAKDGLEHPRIVRYDEPQIMYTSADLYFA